MQTLVTLLLVTFLVRDGSGTALPGIEITVWQDDAITAACLTDSAGTCQFDLHPGSYDVTVAGSAEPLHLYLEPGQDPLPVTLVIGQIASTPVPLWDLSRSRDASPVPFLPPDAIHGPPTAQSALDILRLDAPTVTAEAPPTPIPASQPRANQGWLVILLATGLTAALTALSIRLKGAAHG